MLGRIDGNDVILDAIGVWIPNRGKKPYFEVKIGRFDSCVSSMDNL